MGTLSLKRDQLSAINAIYMTSYKSNVAEIGHLQHIRSQIIHFASSVMD
jgi:hypothetical protein